MGIDPRIAERRALLDEARATAALLRPGARIVAEFADVDDAARFVRAQRSRYVITRGVHYPYAVRERRA